MQEKMAHKWGEDPENKKRVVGKGEKAPRV
jgi:hypothetical protein